MIGHVLQMPKESKNGLSLESHLNIVQFCSRHKGLIIDIGAIHDVLGENVALLWTSLLFGMITLQAEHPSEYEYVFSFSFENIYQNI